MMISLNLKVRFAGYSKFFTQSIRPERDAVSPTASKVDSLENRISPPAINDCSGSHWREVPLNDIVLTLPRASAPPMASMARLTRSTLRCGDVAQDAMAKERNSNQSMRFMAPPFLFHVVRLQNGARMVREQSIPGRNSSPLPIGEGRPGLGTAGRLGAGVAAKRPNIRLLQPLLDPGSHRRQSLRKPVRQVAASLCHIRPAPALPPHLLGNVIDELAGRYFPGEVGGNSGDEGDLAAIGRAQHGGS